MRRKMLGEPGRRSGLSAAPALTGQRSLLGLDAAAETGKQRVVGVEHERALALVRARMWIHPRGAGDHLLKPGPAADVGEGGHHRHLRRIEPLVGHGHRDQDRRLRRQPEGGQGLGGIPLIRGRQPHLPLGLPGRHPAPQHLAVASGAALVGSHHEQLAQTPRGLADSESRARPGGGPEGCAWP